MTAYLAKRVAARLNSLKVPGCELACPLGQLLLRWTTEAVQYRREIMKLRNEVALLRLRIGLWQAVFSRYEQLKGNGWESVEIDEVVNDFKKCNSNMEDPE